MGRKTTKKCSAESLRETVRHHIVLTIPEGGMKLNSRESGHTQVVQMLRQGLSGPAAEHLDSVVAQLSASHANVLQFSKDGKTCIVAPAFRKVYVQKQERNERRQHIKRERELDRQIRQRNYDAIRDTQMQPVRRRIRNWTPSTHTAAA